MIRVVGVDTICDLSEVPPQVTELSFDEVYQFLTCLESLNSKYVATVPYCFICKVPLDWLIADREDPSRKSGDLIFVCPGCKREWVADKQWGRGKKK